MSKEALINKIDALLPQTQCQLCQYQGCRPYAEAIVNEHESINRCLPGGVETLQQLAKMTHQDATPYITEMEEKARPETVAIIQEDTCIGCTKCIQACPTDAIIGAAKQMHTVITDACTGCELCLPPCPVDCIDILPLTQPSKPQKMANAVKWRARYNARNLRLRRLASEKQANHKAAKLSEDASETLAARQEAIKQAVLRSKAKRKIHG